MDKIIELTGPEMVILLRELRELGSAEGLQRIRRLRVTVDGDTFKYKINDGIWSPPFGHLDPECEAARLRSSPLRRRAARSEAAPSDDIDLMEELRASFDRARRGRD